jgi:hypothetical protein
MATKVIRQINKTRPIGGRVLVVKMHHLKEVKSRGSEEFEKGK